MSSVCLRILEKCLFQTAQRLHSNTHALHKLPCSNRAKSWGVCNTNMCVCACLCVCVYLQMCAYMNATSLVYGIQKLPCSNSLKTINSQFMWIWMQYCFFGNEPTIVGFFCAHQKSRIRCWFRKVQFSDCAMYVYLNATLLSGNEPPICACTWLQCNVSFPGRNDADVDEISIYTYIHIYSIYTYILLITGPPWKRWQLPRSWW